MRKDVGLYLFLFCISGHAVGKEINSDDDKSSGIAFLSLGSGLAISGVSTVLSALFPIAAIGYFVYDYANNSKKAKEAKEKQLQEQIEANQRRANEEQRLQQLQKEHQRMLEQEALNNQLRAKEQLLNESLKMIDSIPFKASSDNQDFLPMQHGPFASWEMPIYIDAQGRYCCKISCKLLEQESTADVENPNIKPKISEFLAESAWAVFDKAGEFLFEQNEDGTINYASTACSFGLMAICLCYSGGLGPILSMADKTPGFKEVVQNIIISTITVLKTSSAAAIKVLTSNETVNKFVITASALVVGVSNIGNFTAGIQSFFDGSKTCWDAFKQLCGFCNSKKETVSAEKIIKPPANFGSCDLVYDINQQVFCDSEKRCWSRGLGGRWEVRNHPADKPVMLVSDSGEILWRKDVE